MGSPTLLASPSSTSTPLSSPPLPTTARGPLMLRLTPTSCTVDTTATLTATATPTLTATTARGPLMPSPRLMLIPTSCMVDTTAMPTATDILMLMEDTTTASKL